MSNSPLYFFFVISKMWLLIENNGEAIDGQGEVIFKEGIECRRPAHCKKLVLEILCDQWQNESSIFKLKSRS